jgi:glycerophosphoryl diester phosphodiesterase
VSPPTRARRRTARALTLAAVLLFAAAPALGQPRVAGHRGGAALWPENSLLAFRQALAAGVEFLETDVHPTADGELVILHDPTLDRTTTGRGAVRDARLADLTGLRLRAADGSVTGEPIPTLAQLLDLMRPSRAELLLEIKAGPDRRRYPGIEEKVLAALRPRDLTARTVIMGFHRETVQRVRELDPAIRTALLVARSQIDRAGVPATDAVTWATAVGATALGLQHTAVDAAVVAAARRAGVLLGAWTVNEEADIRRMLDLGVDVVISDRPDVAKRLLAR